MQELILKYLKEHPKALFAVWILAALGSWVINLANWGEATSTQAIGSLILGIVAVAGAGGTASIIAKVNLPGIASDDK
jgi:hypothetical protein